MKIISLLPEERKELIKLEKQIKDKKAAIRIRVILALDLGYSVEEVAKLFLLDEDTISHWKKKYDKRQFFSDWLGEEYVGYKGKLTEGQEAEVDKFVENNVVTDCQEIVDFIKVRYSKLYTINGVTKLLHRLNFVYKQIVPTPGKLNEEKQKAFVKEYEDMKDNKGKDEVILFADGVHPTHNLHKTKAWIKRGEEKQVKTNTGRKRLNINGALDPETMNVTVYYSKTINAQMVIEFFKKLEARYIGKKITLIVDNATYYKNKEVKEYLERSNCRIKLIFLPSYSPNLNFIERLWKYMKKYIIGVKYREKFKEFDDDIHQFFDHIDQYEGELRQFIGNKLHLVQLSV